MGRTQDSHSASTIIKKVLNMSRNQGPSEASKYPPTEFSLKYAKVLAPNGKLIGPDQVFGENGRFDKDVEEKTKLAFKVTMKKLEKYNTASECNKEHLKTAKVDQIIECFPNTLLKLLPNTIQKTKWTCYWTRTLKLPLQLSMRNISNRPWNDWTMCLLNTFTRAWIPGYPAMSSRPRMTPT